MPAAASERRLQIDTIRALSMDAVQRADSGHPGTAMALAPAGAHSSTRASCASTRPTRPGRSATASCSARATPASCSTSMEHLDGLRPQPRGPAQFRQWDSRTPGHPERGHTPGVEITTGPLGQGFANAVGMAMAERSSRDRFNRPGPELVDHRTWVICSDGDMMEGDQPRSRLDRRALRLGKLIACYDDNRITIDGTTTISDRRARSTSRACTPTAGTCSASPTPRTSRRCRPRSRRAGEERERPSFIALRSHIAYPAPHARDTAAAHGCAAGRGGGRARPRRRWAWIPSAASRSTSPSTAHDLRPARRARSAATGRRASRAGARRSRRWPATGTWPGAGACARAGATRCRASASEKPSTRQAGREAMAAFAPVRPDDVRRRRGPRRVHPHRASRAAGCSRRSTRAATSPFGIREHAMGAIVNGAAAHGGIVKPYGSTFLIFSDYMRPTRAPLGADGPAGRVGLDARLGRARRGRPDPPAGRAVRLAARDPGPVGDPARRRERDLVRVAGRAGAHRRPGGLLLSRQNVAVIERRRRGERGRAAARRATCCGTPGGRHRAGDHPDRHRRRGRPDARRPRGSSPPRAHARARRLDAVPGAVRAPGRRLPRAGAAARRPRTTRGRAGRQRELVAVGRPRRRRARPSTASAHRLPARACWRSSASRRRGSPAREGAARVPRPRVRRERARRESQRQKEQQHEAAEEPLAGTRPQHHRRRSTGSRPSARASGSTSSRDARSAAASSRS